MGLMEQQLQAQGPSQVVGDASPFLLLLPGLCLVEKRVQQGLPGLFASDLVVKFKVAESSTSYTVRSVGSLFSREFMSPVPCSMLFLTWLAIGWCDVATAMKHLLHCHCQ